MSHHESAAKGPDARMVDRMLFFSDAVFAIVLTLLVIELHPPKVALGDEAAIWRGLSELVPHLIALAISFIFAGGWWLAHMSATRRLRQFDMPSAILNLVFLFWIVLFPFAAALFGANIWSLAGLAVYWIISSGAAFSMSLLQLVMTRGGGRLVGGVSGGERWGPILMTLGPAIGLGLSAWGALNGNSILARYGWVVMTPVFFVAPFLMRKPKPKSAPQSPPEQA